MSNTDNETRDEVARKMVFFTVLCLGGLLLYDGWQLDRHAERLNRLDKSIQERKSTEPDAQPTSSSLGVSPSDKQVVWKAIINYGAGYRVDDENGNEVAGDLNSYNEKPSVIHPDNAMIDRAAVA